MTYQVRLTLDAIRDLESLDNSQRLHVRKSLVKLEQQGGQVGEPLRGKLAGCRKLKHRKLGLRVIFRETEQGVEIIEVVAIGKRSDEEIYRIAEARIARLKI